MTASARPQRLLNLAETTSAIADAFTTRAGWVEDDWETYTLYNGVDWRFDAGDLPGALRAWAETLRTIGEFTRGVGGAFLVADSGDPGGYHELGEGRLRDMMPCGMRVRLDESTATDEVDWGDPDDPPAWLDALDYSAMVVGHAGSAVDAWNVAYVVGSGAAAAWAPETPAVLGRFATPAQLAKFATLFSLGSAGLAGLTAGSRQRQADAASLNYTDSEITARATARGVGTAGGALVSSAAGVGAASIACGPGAPVCAGAVIITVGVFGTSITDKVLNAFIEEPGPAEHDPDVVRDQIDGVAPDTLLRDIPGYTWNVIEPVEQAGDDAGQAAFDARHPYLDTEAMLADPRLIAAHDLPATWVELQVFTDLVGGTP